ncbi:MAG: single-stranded DNA-binding protein [Thermomicrobiales bacterium]
MAGLSKVILVGNLGRDPETRYTPNGTMNVQFSMAVSRRYNDSSGQQQEQTNWFRVTAWGRLAETLDGLTQRGFVTKGRQVYVEGRLDAREYQDSNGVTRTSLDVNMTEFLLVGNRGDTGGDGGIGGEPGGGGNTGARNQGSSDQGDSGNFDDVPF